MSSRSRNLIRRVLAASMLLALFAAAPVTDAAEKADESGFVFDARYRHEFVDDAAFSTHANAYTLRLRLGYRWVFAPGWQLFADGEHVQSFFGDHYNSTANGQTRYPLVADPEADEFNQVFIAYAGEHVGTRLGRQRVVVDNQRFFGNVGWRQNEQTFDAFNLEYAFSNGGPKLRYVYMDRVLRVFGHENPDPLLRDWDLNGNLFHAEQALPLGLLTGYAYLVENLDVATLSTSTLGARWTGTQAFDTLNFGWSLEYAHQSDYANSPIEQSASYLLLEPTLAWKGVTYKAGWEMLGAGDVVAFSTPYATLHAFNGWADRFLTTPIDGLDDLYLGVNGKFGKFGWAVIWHDFHAERGNQHYGNELDASLSYPVRKDLTALFKVAAYNADDYATDVTKLWLSLDYKF